MVPSSLILGLMLVFSFFSTASASQKWIVIHHEAQGNHDETWTKCMPDDAWNGHDDHEGDWRSPESWDTKEECESVLNATLTPVYTLTSTATATDTVLPTGTTIVVSSTPTGTPNDPTELPTGTRVVVVTPGTPQVTVTLTSWGERYPQADKNA